MARARTYVRDNRGRFASSPGGGGGSRPKTRMASRGANRLTRDNAGKITSVGGDGATARGGRLRTASGKQRGAVVAKVKGGAASSTIAKGGRGVRGSVARSVAAVRKDQAAAAKPVVAKQQPQASSKKPAKKESKRNISDAKASRIIARIDANRPGLRRASGSDRRSRNALQTHDRASEFVRAASGRARKRGTPIDLAESVRRAVRNAKPKPIAAKPSRPSSKLIPRGQGAKVKRSKPAGAVVKPKGLKPGALAERRAVKARARVQGYFIGGSKRTSSSGRYLPGGTKALPFVRSNAQGRITRAASDKSPAARAERIVRRMENTGANRSGAKLERAKRTQDAAAIFLKYMSGSPGYTRGANKGMPKSNRQRFNELWANLANKGKKAEYGRLVAMMRPAKQRPTKASGSASTVYRSRKQAAEVYNRKTNALGKATAAERGFNQAISRGQRGGLVHSAPRIVYRRGKHKQLTLSGGIETVKASAMRPVGRRKADGKIALYSSPRRR